MSQLTLFEVQKAIFQRLTGDAALMNVATDVFDYIPTADDHDIAPPYIVIINPQLSPWDTKNTGGEQVTLNLQAWTNQRGNKQAVELLNLVIAALKKEPLSIEGGFFMARFQVTNANVISELDGKVRRGLLSLSATIIHQK